MLPGAGRPACSAPPGPEAAPAARCFSSAPQSVRRPRPGPARPTPGSDRVVVGVPQADGVREEAAGEVQRHALHVADGAHRAPGVARAQARWAWRERGAGTAGARGGNGGKARLLPPNCPLPTPPSTDTRTDTPVWFTKSVLRLFILSIVCCFFFFSIRTYITKFIVEVYMHDLTHKYQCATFCRQPDPL